ncbi:MAG: hypothetical protein U0441_09935 [Polyangiaceae bacterium]
MPSQRRAYGSRARDIARFGVVTAQRGLLLAIAALVGACMEAPAPAKAPQGEPTPGALSYQQQAGYGAYPQQPMPAPTATAQGGALPWVPGLIEVAPRTVPDAVAQLDRAEQILGLVLTHGGPKDERSTTVGQPAPGKETQASAPADSPVPLADPCLIACAALASMKRSAEHVCTMSGEADATCGTARARVQRAEQRVTAACPACAAGK